MKNKISSQIYVFATGIIICLMFFGLGEKLSFLTTSFGRIFAWTPGDIYDASLNNWFLENNFQYFLKGGNLLNISKVFEANLYWPENNSLAMSDNWILLTPIYAIIRTFLSPNFAFTGIIVLSLTANVMACYKLCRHATEKKIYRLIASCLSGFSLTVLARIGHAQLMPAFAGVLAIDAFISSLRISELKKNLQDIKELKNSKKEISISINKIYEGIIWLLLQIGIGFYQGAFFSIASFSLILVILVNKFSSKNIYFRVLKIKFFDYRSKLFFIIKSFFFAFLCSFNFLIYKQYFLYSQNQGGRSWGEVSTQIPKFWSLWFSTLSNSTNISFPAPVQSVTYTGPFWEHSMFPGYTFVSLLIIGIWFGLKSKGSKDQDQNVKWRVMTLSKVGLLMLLISIGIGGTNPVITFWILLWKFVPGISAIRAVSRIGIPIVLILSPLIAWTLSELEYRLDRKALIITFSFLFILFLNGNVTKGIKRFDSTEFAAKKDAIVNNIEKIVKANNCKAFYMTSPDTNNWMYDRVYPQMMAMWASIKLGIPTSSGYSGNHPNEGWNHMMTKPQLEEWLKKKGIEEKSLRDVCYINGNEVLN